MSFVYDSAMRNRDGCRNLGDVRNTPWFSRLIDIIKYPWLWVHVLWGLTGESWQRCQEGSWCWEDKLFEKVKSLAKVLENCKNCRAQRRIVSGDTSVEGCFAVHYVNHMFHILVYLMKCILWKTAREVRWVNLVVRSFILSCLTLSLLAYTNDTIRPRC